MRLRQTFAVNSMTFRPVTVREASATSVNLWRSTESLHPIVEVPRVAKFLREECLPKFFFSNRNSTRNGDSKKKVLKYNSSHFVFLNSLIHWKAVEE